MCSDQRASEPPFSSVAVLGLGVMGGSLARALAEARPEVRVAGWSPDPSERADALRERVIQVAPERWEEAVAGADLVVLALPLDATCRMLASLRGTLGEEATLADVASLKAPVARAIRAAGLASCWVGAHPMAGSEGSGYARSRADLYRGAPIWLVAEPEAERRIPPMERFWRDLGARPKRIQAEPHDRSMALVSHLPQLVANALAAEMERRGVDPASLGPGGRDTIRLAGSAPEMWLDLLTHAPEVLPDALSGVAATLVDIAAALEAGDLDEVEELMTTTRAWRAREARTGGDGSGKPEDPEAPSP